MSVAASASKPKAQPLQGQDILSGDFDKSQFNQELNLLALKVPCSSIGPVRKKLEKSKLLLNIPRVKPIRNIPENKGEKLILLHESCTDPKDARLEEICQDLGLEPALPHVHVLDYNFFTSDQVLRRLLPRETVADIPSSFETVGHIAHLNLRDEHLPYKKIIGKVIIDKNDRIRTVVNKTQKIENQFRVLPLEVLAGEDDMETLVIQYGVRYKLNYAEVYWNSRLEHEHNRLITEAFKPSDCILDMTCGVGPFTVPAAKKGCKVYANDLNPKCAEYTKINLKLNKIPKESMPEVYCMDAREFVKLMDERGVVFQHAVINLPASGLDFIDCFASVQSSPSAFVHCYTFVPPDGFGGPVEKAERLGYRNATVREVRDVAPNKRMVLLSFQLPPAEEKANKKQKV